MPESLMVEPTETESRETLYAFVAAMARIWAEVQAGPEFVRSAPPRNPREPARRDPGGAAP